MIGVTMVTAVLIPAWLNERPKPGPFGLTAKQVAVRSVKIDDFIIIDT